MEYRGETETAALEMIKEKLRRNTEQVLKEAESRKIKPREAAVELALHRVRKAMDFRRWSLFSSAPGFV
jgi:glutamate dehydrogenase (NAD(P)+)